MILRSLESRSFRNLRSGRLTLHPSINIFVGDNGEGKTNLLEAIYFLATTKSFRTARNLHLPRLGSGATFVQGEVVDGAGVERTVSAGISVAPERRRELLVNGQKVPLHDYLQVLQVFAYSAARLAIVRGGPDERRRFLDRGIAGIHRGYLGEMARYARALKQRNALLQQSGGAARRELAAWNAELVEAAVPIATARKTYAAELGEEVARILEAHHYHLRDLHFVYRPNGFEEGITTEAGLAALERMARRELATGFSLWGPHRDNLEILTGEHPAAEILSSGEVKMTVLFLKLAKAELYRGKTDEAPLFLLDDIDAELDLSVIERLLTYLAQSIQLFTTSPKDAFFEQFTLGSNTLFRVENGSVERAGEI